MIKRKIAKFAIKFKALSPTIQGFIIFGILLAIGIILRWEYIWEEMSRGFNFFNR